MKNFIGTGNKNGVQMAEEMTKENIKLKREMLDLSIKAKQYINKNEIIKSIDKTRKSFNEAINEISNITNVCPNLLKEVVDDFISALKESLNV
ncbi:MAG TPA: hypothetical protein DCS19_10515 [Flavobacterium sp.]|nr:hypothetical protein [Flavobacterium sp.]